MQRNKEKAVTRPITAQDWNDIETKLAWSFSSVELVCDGYPITIKLEPVSRLQISYVIYVNGRFEGKWLFEDCEERRRFLRPRTKQIYSNKLLNSIKKVSKQEYKKVLAANKHVYYDYKWTSFRSLKSHLIKHNEVIELVVTDERSLINGTNYQD